MQKPNWSHVKERIEAVDDGASTWIKLREDGAKAVVVFVGDPFAREVVCLS